MNFLWNATAGQGCVHNNCFQRWGTDSRDCILDPLCNWDGNLSHCRDNYCTIYDDMTDCLNSPTCEWIDYNSPEVCAEAECAYTNMNDCANDPRCYVYHYSRLRLPPECFKAGCKFHPNEASCVDDPIFDCWWDQFNQTTGPVCREDRCSLY